MRHLEADAERRVDLSYHVSGNAAVYLRGPRSYLVHPTHAELAGAFRACQSARIHIDMSDGGGIACVAGVADFLAAHSITEPIELSLENLYPLEGLPIASFPRDRIASVMSQYPRLKLRTVCASKAHLLSLFGAPGLERGQARRVVPPHGAKPPQFSSRGLMVFGTGSSVGKGTFVLLLGLALRRRGLDPIPFKAVSGLSCRYAVPAELQQCPSTLLHWHLWGSRGEPLPNFLNPLLLLPPEPHLAHDGTFSAFDPDKPGLRIGYSYQLEEFYNGYTWDRLLMTLGAAAHAAATYSQRRGGLLLIEGSGSPLDLMGEWDLANETVRAMFGVPYVLVTSADSRGYFSLRGSLVELAGQGLLSSLVGVVACETTAMPMLALEAVTEAIKEVLKSHRVPYLGRIHNDTLIARSLSEDVAPSLHAPVSQSEVARITQRFEHSVDLSRILEAVGNSI